MSQDEFTKLFQYITERFDKVDKALEEKSDKSDMKKVYKLLDKVIDQQEIDNDERLVMGHQLERLDRWVHEFADKIGYKLSV